MYECKVSGGDVEGKSLHRVTMRRQSGPNPRALGVDVQVLATSVIESRGTSPRNSMHGTRRNSKKTTTLFEGQEAAREGEDPIGPNQLPTNMRFSRTAPNLLRGHVLTPDSLSDGSESRNRSFSSDEPPGSSSYRLFSTTGTIGSSQESLLTNASAASAGDLIKEVFGSTVSLTAVHNAVGVASRNLTRSKSHLLGFPDGSLPNCDETLNQAQASDLYLLTYADYLTRIGAEEERAELLKRLQQPAVLGAISGVSSVDMQLGFLPFCHRCGNLCPVEPLNHGLCLTCRSFPQQCSICHFSVKGLLSCCIKCLHGGHAQHMEAWFRESHTCPTGCGCACIFSVN
eukprot:g51120.t1